MSSPDARPHYLYRCYDTAGRLLYIGCTANVKRRMQGHKRCLGRGNRASQWLAACMDRVEVEGPFAGRDAGRAAERDAIQTEQPLFNFQERSGLDFAAWMTRLPIARYLVEQGHRDLAIATACTCHPETLDDGTVLISSCGAHELDGLAA